MTTEKFDLDVELERLGVDPHRVMRLTRKDVKTIVEKAVAEAVATITAISQENLKLKTELLEERRAHSRTGSYPSGYRDGF